MKCPHCQGKKQGVAFVMRKGCCSLEPTPCWFCHGAGEVTKADIDRWEAGRKRRQDRISRGLSLREEAQRLGISAAALSEIESGVLLEINQRAVEEDLGNERFE